MASSAVTSANIYGCVVVRLSDRMMLGKVPGMPPTLSMKADPPAAAAAASSPTLKTFSIPNTVWAELVSKCAAPHFRTSSFLSVLEDDSAAGNLQAFQLDQKEVSLSFHVVTDDSLGFAILADQIVSRREGHVLLDEVAALFKKMFVENAHQLTPKMVDVFTKPCRELLLQYSRAHGSGTSGEDKIGKVKRAVDEAKNLALDNVERAISRGGKIDQIVEQTEDLQFQAQGFQRSSRELSNQLWWNSMKGKLLIGSISGAFVLLVLFTFFYSGGEKK